MVWRDKIKIYIYRKCASSLEQGQTAIVEVWLISHLLVSLIVNEGYVILELRIKSAVKFFEVAIARLAEITSF